MLNLQSEFLDFHDAIKLDDENKELRQKRDILLKKLREKISNEAASYTTFNQGSYAMSTGIKPADGDYDIDVGIRFSINKDDYPDPVAVKKWVYDALEGHTNSVEIRRSCVTVTYQEAGEPIYHVDFACYAASNDDDKLYLAKGKKNSTEPYRFWEISDPNGLLKYIQDLFSDADERAQFRRCIRYLKKWKAESFSSSGNSAPTGIAITALACHYFAPSYSNDLWAEKKVYNDFSALIDLVQAIIYSFSYTWNSEDSCYYHTIKQNLPVEPYNNLFSKMTDKQMESLYAKFISMKETLVEASSKDKKSEATKLLADLFGSDFPVTVERSYVGTSESA